MELIAFNWVPPRAQGFVRDLWVRWTLEELEIPYTVRLIDHEEKQTEAYKKLQPFGQVPVLNDGPITLFESGAIILYLAEKSRRLLPPDSAGKAKGTAWVFAAPKFSGTDNAEIPQCDRSRQWRLVRLPKDLQRSSRKTAY